MNAQTDDTTTEIVHFTITGGALTRHVRDLMLSDEPSKAWRTIVDGLHGNGIEAIAPRVLDGLAEFTGNSSQGIAVSDRTDNKYREQLHYIYGGRLRHRGQWYRPVAYITHFGTEDATHATRSLGFAPNKLSLGFSAWADQRASYYMDNTELAFELQVENQTRTVIFELCSEPPVWWPALPNPQAALDAALKVGRRLDTRGPETAREERELRARFLATEDHATPNEDGELEPMRGTRHLDAPARAPRVTELRELTASEERDFELDESVLDWRAAILAQAKDEWIELRAGDDGTGEVIARVPKAPFICWAIRRTPLYHLMPAWTPVCPSELKQQGDDPYHTDWYIGAGFDLSRRYSHTDELGSAALRIFSRLQEELCGFQCAVLSPGPPGAEEIEGRVGDDIVVLADLNPDHLSEILTARAVITEQGGELAHLAQVAMERSIPMLLCRDARKLYPKGKLVRVDPSNGAIRISLFDPSKDLGYLP